MKANTYRTILNELKNSLIEEIKKNADSLFTISSPNNFEDITLNGNLVHIQIDDPDYNTIITGLFRELGADDISVQLDCNRDWSLEDLENISYENLIEILKEVEYLFDEYEAGRK